MKRKITIKPWSSMSKFRKAVIITIILSIPMLMGLSLLYYGLYINPSMSAQRDSWTELITDVDRLPNGDTLVCSSPISVTSKLDMDPKNAEYLNQMNRVYSLDPNGTIKWQQTGFAWPHEVEYIEYQSAYRYFIADTLNDSLKQFDDSFNLEWMFQPEKINWTEINSEWDNQSYYNNPIDVEWTHINDVDFIRGDDYNQTFDSLLVSINRFDMVILINYTAEFEELQLGDSYGSTENIYWWYGPGEIELPHNPDMLPNGNVVICDSKNGRVLEVNTTTKEIVFELTEAGGKHFKQVKDADYQEVDDTYLISDAGNNRVMLITKTGEILWEWSTDLAFPYEADLLENGNVLISGTTSGAILEVSVEDSTLVWSYYANAGKDFILILVRTQIITTMIISALLLAYRIYRIIELKKGEEIFKKWQWIRLTFISLAFLFLLFVSIYSRRILYTVVIQVVGLFKKG